MFGAWASNLASHPGMKWAMCLAPLRQAGRSSAVAAQLVGQEALLGGRASQFEGSPVGGRGVGGASEAGEQVGAGGVVEVMGPELACAGERVEPGEALGGTVGHRGRDGGVEVDDGVGPASVQ